MEKLYILCVDDQRDVLLSISRDLHAFSSWTVIEECESAEEAAEVLDELEGSGRPLALIVCDHLMPGTLGVDFMTGLEGSGRYPHAKKVLITGQATHADTINAINQAKVDAYVEKPWKAEELQALCRRLLTEFIFDSGRDIQAYLQVADPKVMLQRMRGSE